MMAILQEETKRLNSVLTRFLEFARSEPGERRAFDLKTEAEAVTEMIRHHPDFADVSCEVSGTDGPCLAVGNQEQIRQVLLNLALNGAAAAGEGGKINLHLTVTGASCTCEVHDSGPGFTAEARDNFGTPFFSTKSQGTGLGLATSLKIVQDQGGTLEPGGPEAVGGLVVMDLTIPNAE